MLLGNLSQKEAKLLCWTVELCALEQLGYLAQLSGSRTFRPRSVEAYTHVWTDKENPKYMYVKKNMRESRLWN